MGKRGREYDFTTNSLDSAHLPPNSPDKLCAAAGGSHRHLKLLRPGHLAPPAALPGVPGRRSQVGVASVCPSHRQGARSAQEAPKPGPDSPPQTPLTCLHGPIGAPESRAERLSSAAAAAAKPQFPQRIDSSGWRWKGGGKEPKEAKEEGGFRRDPGARVGAGALGEGEKENHPGSGLSRQREAGTGRMG